MSNQSSHLLYERIESLEDITPEVVEFSIVDFMAIMSEGRHSGYFTDNKLALLHRCNVYAELLCARKMCISNSLSLELKCSVGMILSLPRLTPANIEGKSVWR